MSEAMHERLLQVIALDDDVAQRHVLNVTLHGIAQVAFCATPEEALAAIRGTRFDVAILDVHLRRSRSDGLDVARAVHEIDPSLEVLLYTGDESAGILEGALEVRALRRILKASPRAEIVKAVRDCAEATRRNRVANRDAAIGKDARRHLEEQTRTLEISHTVADLYRGFFHSLANDLTALGVTGVVVSSLAERAAAVGSSASAAKRRTEDLQHVADANAAVLARISAMVRQMTTEAGDLTNENQRAQVGVALQALAKIFIGDVGLNGGLRVVPPSPELVLPISATALINVLRNAVDFLLENSVRPTSACVSAELVHLAEAKRILSADPGLFVMNRDALAASHYVWFHCRCEAADVRGVSFTAAFAGPPEAGPLYALAHVSARCSAPAICRQSASAAAVDLLFPAWR